MSFLFYEEIFFKNVRLMYQVPNKILLYMFRNRPGEWPLGEEDTGPN